TSTASTKLSASHCRTTKPRPSSMRRTAIKCCSTLDKPTLKKGVAVRLSSDLFCFAIRSSGLILRQRQDAPPLLQRFSSELFLRLTERIPNSGGANAEDSFIRSYAARL